VVADGAHDLGLDFAGLLLENVVGEFDGVVSPSLKYVDGLQAASECLKIKPSWWRG
jgi:hypothetical protein